MPYTIQSRSQTDINELVTNNLNLVHSWAHRFCKRPDQYEDLFQEGCIALTEAAMTFDADNSKKANFGTHASLYIQCAIKDYLFRDRLIRLPENNRTSITAYHKARAQLDATTTVDISEDVLYSLAKDLGLSREIFNLVNNSMGSLEFQLRTNESNQPTFILEDTLEDKTADVEANVLDNTAAMDIWSTILVAVKNAKTKRGDYKKLVLDFIKTIIYEVMNEGKVSVTWKSTIDKNYPELVVTANDTEEEKKKKEYEYGLVYTASSSVKLNLLKSARSKLAHEGYSL